MFEPKHVYHQLQNRNAMKDFEAIGLWHLPADPVRRVAGTLRYSDENGLRLSLIGTLRNDPNPWPTGRPEEYPRICGIVNESPFGKMFTLVDCFEAGGTFPMPGLTTQTIHANRACVSHCFVEDETRFDAIRISFTHLHEWLNKTGFLAGPRSQGTDAWIVEHRTPEPVCLTLGDKPMTLCVSRQASFRPGESSVREDALIRIDHLGQLSLDAIEKRYNEPLHNFFTLAADTPIAVEEEAAFSDQLRESEDGNRLPIQILGQPIFRPKEESGRRQRHEMLFTYQDVEASFGDLLNRWLDFSSEFAAFCGVFFGSLYAPGEYLETRFLAAVEAMILFFAKSRSPDEETRLATESARNRLLGPFSGRRKEWMAMAFPTDAELDFGGGLAAALSEHAAVMQPLLRSDTDVFVDQIATSHRYYVRYDPAAEAHALGGMDLHWATEKLNVLLKASILDRLGMPRDHISKLFARNAQYRYLKGIG